MGSSLRDPECDICGHTIFMLGLLSAFRLSRLRKEQETRLKKAGPQHVPRDASTPAVDGICPGWDGGWEEGQLAAGLLKPEPEACDSAAFARGSDRRAGDLATEAACK